jgi:hypothetical protein
MKKRIIWKMFALTIVTLGIYRLYWFVKTRREMMNLNPNIKILSPLWLFLPVILVVVSIGVFIATLVQSTSNMPSYCKTLDYTSSNFETREALPDECESDAPVWGILLLYGSIFLFYPLVVIWLWGYSKGVETITGGHTSFAIALIILLLVPDGIDILIVQDSFNKLGEAVSHGANSSGAPTPVGA